MARSAPRRQARDRRPRVSGEGWAWVEAVTDISTTGPCRSSTADILKRAELSEAEQSELDALVAEYDSIVDDESRSWPSARIRIRGKSVGVGKHLVRGDIYDQKSTRKLFDDGALPVFNVTSSI